MRFLSVFVFILFLSVSVQAKDVVVLELFTTQLCGDTPPADILFDELLKEDPDIIGISCHVKSYDKEDGARDILARKFCDDRYSAYFSALNVGSFSVPFMVANGKYDMHGGHEELVRSGVAMARVEDRIVPITMSVTAAYLEFELDAQILSKNADVWLFAYDDYHEPDHSARASVDGVAVPDVAYINVATHLVKVLSWDGEGKGFSFPLQDIRADGYVILVQNDEDGVLAAGRVRQHPMSVGGGSDPVAAGVISSEAR